MLSDLLASVCSSLGVGGVGDPLGLSWNSDGRPVTDDTAVVFLVDGLGERQLVDHGDLAPTLMAMLPWAGSPLRAPFPSTTAVSLASLGTGLVPAVHGIVGTAYRRDDSRVMWPLSWKDDPDPLVAQPLPTMFERAETAGVTVTRVAPRSFEASGLTRAVLRGGAYRGADSAGERIGGLLDARRAQGRGLIYIYWPDLDKVGHLRGVDSPDWRAELQHTDMMVRQLIDNLPERSCLYVTADHGMIDTEAVDRVTIDGDPSLTRDVALISGEPRVRHVYAESGYAAEVARRWRETLAQRAWVVERDEALDLGLFGHLDAPDDGPTEHIGDVVAIARGTTVLASDRVDSVLSGLRGQHGGLEDAETAIPLRLSRK